MHAFGSHANYDIEASSTISLFHCVMWAVTITADLLVLPLAEHSMQLYQPHERLSSSYITWMGLDPSSGSGTHVCHSRICPSRPYLDPPPLVNHLWFPTTSAGLYPARISGTLLIGELFGDLSKRQSSSPCHSCNSLGIWAEI